VMALLRQLHPSWSVEELKALAMNTATHDLTTQPLGAGSAYTPARIGAGRVDVKNAGQSLGVVFNADDPGAVSVSFGVANVPVNQTNFTLTKHFTVENKGGPLASPLTYTIGFTPAASWTVSGVTYSVVDNLANPVTSVTVDPGKAKELSVMLTVNGTLLKHTLDATMTTTQNGGGRNYMTESGGYVTFTLSDGATLPSLPDLRLPVYAVTRPVASMQGGPYLPPLSFMSGTSEINLTGTGIHTGTTFPTDISSLVTALELKYVGKDKGLGPEAASGNIQYAGVMSDVAGEGNLMANTWLFFGVSTFGRWSTPNDTEFDIYIDTTGDGIPDYVMWNSSLADSSGNASDAFVSVVYNLTTHLSYTQTYLNGIPGNAMDTNLFNNNVMVIPVKASRLGLTDASASIHFWIDTFTRESGFVEEIGGTNGIAFNAKNLVIDTSGGAAGSPIWDDLPGSTIPVAYNYANAGPSGVMGVLLLHHHNSGAATAQVIQVGMPTFLPIIANPEPEP
jgi:hypothetical protein